MAIEIDNDLQGMEDFRYQILVSTFGKEEADKIIADTEVEQADDLDDDIKEVVEFGSETTAEIDD